MSSEAKVAVALALVIAGLGPSARAEGRGAAEITMLRGGQSGVTASALNYTPPLGVSGDRKSSVTDPPNLTAQAQAPAPIAISPHNCVPRLDPRGVSLSFEFSEGAADCVSFVSPPPAPAPGPTPGRRPRRPTPETLAQSAYDRVISLAPRPSLEIAPAEIGLTGLDSFFWVGNDLRPVTATAGVPGLTVTAEARPVRYSWGFGDGTSRMTAHPGRPWNPATPGSVAHLYETKGRYDVTVEILWAARWRINGGAWRDLGYFSNDDSVEYPVREMVAVLVQGR